jgi:hypothetical protein
MCLAVVNITSAQTIANPKRTKYSRRKANAVVEGRGAGAAQHFVMLRDGAMAAGRLVSSDQVCATFLRGVDGLVRTHAARQPS